MKEREEIDHAAEQLSQELGYGHDAIMAVHRFAEGHADPQVQLDCMKAAARMMQAQAAVALSLKRLRSDEATFAFRYIHEGGPPTPKKSKTNGPARVEEVWEEKPAGFEEGCEEVWDVETQA